MIGCTIGTQHLTATSPGLLGISPLNEFEEALVRAQANLDSLHLNYALVGGFAVGLRAEPRFTQDLDLAVATSGDEEAEQIIMALHRAGYALVATVEQDAVGRLATARLVCPKTKLTVDLLFASSGIEPEIAAKAEVLDFTSEIQLPVAQLGHLIATKVLSRKDSNRPQDRVDLYNLFAQADEEQLRLARESLCLMRERGFQRDKDLPEAFWAAFWDLHLNESDLSVWEALPFGLLENFDRTCPVYISRGHPAQKIALDFWDELHMFPGLITPDHRRLKSHFLERAEVVAQLVTRGLVKISEARSLLEDCELEETLRRKRIPN